MHASSLASYPARSTRQKRPGENDSPLSNVCTRNRRDISHTINAAVAPTSKRLTTTCQVGTAVLAIRISMAIGAEKGMRLKATASAPLGELASRTDEVPTDVPVVMVCRSGNRSAEAVEILQKAGFANIHNMTGGMISWKEAGYLVEAER